MNREYGIVLILETLYLSPTFQKHLVHFTATSAVISDKNSHGNASINF